MIENESEQIETGIRLELFLADPAVVDAIKRLEARYFDAFKSAKPDELLTLQARVTVLGDFLTELDAKVGHGKVASATRARRERK